MSDAAALAEVAGKEESVGLVANERGKESQLPHAEVLRFVTSAITAPVVTTP